MKLTDKTKEIIFIVALSVLAVVVAVIVKQDIL